MGCHTWFARPMTSEEIENMRLRAVEQVHEFLADEPEYAKQVLHSIKTDECCIQGKFDWFCLGWGSLDSILTRYGPNKIKYIDIPGPDVCRVKTYPSKIIYNFKQFRRYLGKKFFKFPNWERDMIRQMFKDNPGCIMYWA